MPRLDKTGPDGKGCKSGRKLGKCSEKDDKALLENLGKGLGLKRKSGGGTGSKKRLRSGQ